MQLKEAMPARTIEAVSLDSGNLPPWLKDAQESAVIARLRQNLEAQGDERRVPLVRARSPCPEAGSTARRRAYRAKASEQAANNLPQVDTEGINDPTVDENELAMRHNVLESARQRAEQAEKEADRLRMELSVVKDQLDNSEMASAELVDELAAARDIEQQLSMQIDALRKELKVSAAAAKNAAERAEADLATLHCQLEAMRSELSGKISELNEMKPQLDVARMQLCILQETYVSRPSLVKPAEMHAHHADEELALVKAKFGAMNNRDINKPTELALADTQRLLAELNKENSQPDQISKLEAEVESAQNAQAVLRDEWWIMKEPSYNILDSKIVVACSWEVSYGCVVTIRVAKSLKAAIIGRKAAGMVVCGRQERGWVALTSEPGFMKIADSGRILLRKV